jgi:hypothetical protein
MKALISPMQENIIVQVENDDSIFEVSLPLYWLDCPDNITAYNYQYNQGQFVPYIVENTAEQNKELAISLLQQTDWTSVADVGNPEMSNPYLENQAAFIAWRSQVRAIAVTPIAGNLEIFKQIPQENWQTV